jgi:hypothetical protein
VLAASGVHGVWCASSREALAVCWAAAASAAAVEARVAHIWNWRLSHTTLCGECLSWYILLNLEGVFVIKQVKRTDSLFYKFVPHLGTG